MPHPPVHLPALFAQMGDWRYFTTVMRFEDAAARIQFAENINEIRPGAQLSDMIQRALTGKRADAIAEYLVTNEDRFFNALVVAVYGGDPTWIEFGISRAASAAGLEQIPEWTESAFGFLKLAGTEKLFPVDGQHRLAGIQEALQRDPELADDKISVIFVSHATTVPGRQRTRKLFTTLNKAAVRVGKSDIIALDESDTAAIITRRLVEQHPMFNAGQVLAKYNAANLSHDDGEHFVTIIKLYDLVGYILTRVVRRFSRDVAARLKYVRPDDATLESYYLEVVNFFETFINTFPELKSYFDQTGQAAMDVVSQQRFSERNVLFRSVGLEIMLRLIAQSGEPEDWQTSLARLAALPRRFGEVPYRNVLFSVGENKILPGRTRLTTRLLLHMLGNGTDPDGLRVKYAEALGQELADTQLPPVLP